jgi:hypothetical protein
VIQLAKPSLGNWGDRELYALLSDLRARKSWVTFTWNPPNVPAASTVSTTLTIVDGDFAGLRVGQSVSVTPPAAIDEGLVWGAYVGTNDTVTIRLGNVTALGINPASGTWTLEGWQIT